MSWVSKGLDELREKMEWEDSQYLIDALGVALGEDASLSAAPLSVSSPSMSVALRALHRDSVAKAFTAIINGGVLPVNRSRDNAQIMEFLKELTGEL